MAVSVVRLIHHAYLFELQLTRNTLALFQVGQDYVRGWLGKQSSLFNFLAKVPFTTLIET
jgi:hypothetical protein